MNLKETLTQVFSTNFMAYLHSHIAHVNTVGRNFQSDHALLQGIYQDLQDQIDHLAELLRTIYAMMPQDLSTIQQNSIITDYPMQGSADDLLTLVYEDIEALISEYRTLAEVADNEGSIEISNFAQDRLLHHQKQCWQLRATLGMNNETSEAEEEDEDIELF